MKERYTRTIDIIILTLLIIVLIRIRDLRECTSQMMEYTSAMTEYMNTRAEFETRLIKAVSESEGTK